MTPPIEREVYEFIGKATATLELSTKTLEKVEAKADTALTKANATAETLDRWGWVLGHVVKIIGTSGVVLGVLYTAHRLGVW